VALKACATGIFYWSSPVHAPPIKIPSCIVVRLYFDGRFSNC
jgi:hypothetical protein